MPDDASAILLFDGETHNILQQVTTVMMLLFTLLIGRVDGHRFFTQLFQ